MKHAQQQQPLSIESSLRRDACIPIPRGAMSPLDELRPAEGVGRAVDAHRQGPLLTRNSSAAGGLQRRSGGLPSLTSPCQAVDRIVSLNVGSNVSPMLMFTLAPIGSDSSSDDRRTHYREVDRRSSACGAGKED